MKKLAKIVSMLLTVAICVLLPNATAMTVSAEEPVTYYLKYIDSDDGWRFQVGSTWSSSSQDREMYYLLQEIKDGDLLIIDGNHSGSILDIPVRLSNVTFIQGSSAVVTAKSIDSCYVLSDAVCAVNGDVTNAYIYDHGACSFNNNVGTLNILNDPAKDNSLLHASATVGGTVNHLIGHDGSELHYEFYNIAAGKLVIEDGDVKTDEAYYSTTASASAPAQSSTTNGASADEYDDVPKTGDSTLIFWLLGISAICFAGRFALNKTASRA